MWAYFKENMAPMIKKVQCHYDESNNTVDIYNATLDSFGEAVLKCIEKTPESQVCTKCKTYI